MFIHEKYIKITPDSSKKTVTIKLCTILLEKYSH